MLHFVVPRIYESIVPQWLPARRALVYGSGVAEAACAVGLVTGQRWAGPASAGVLVAVWPANLQMAVDSMRSQQPWWRRAAMVSRLPLQVPMIRMALAARRPGH